VLQFQTASIADSYNIDWDSCLGTGANGAHGKVFEITRRQDGQPFALKIVPDDLCSRREVELQLACRHHEGILKVQEVFANLHLAGVAAFPRPCLFIVMELVRGSEAHSDLFEYLADNITVCEQDVKFMVVSLARTLKYLHDQSIAHRDFKPENVLISNIDKAGNIHVKLADFGFATRTPMDLTQPPLFTVGFMAPEVLRSFKHYQQCRRSLEYGTQADMWALGVALYMLLTGHMPLPSTKLNHRTETAILTGSIPFNYADWLPVSVDGQRVVRSLLTVDPSARMSADQLLADPWLADVL
jgi:serine/threonine protein kinase